MQKYFSSRHIRHILLTYIGLIIHFPPVFGRNKSKNDYKSLMWIKRASNKKDFFYIENLGYSQTKILTTTNSGDLEVQEKYYPFFSAVPMKVIETKSDIMLELDSAEDKINTVILNLASIGYDGFDESHRIEDSTQIRLFQSLYNQLESNLIIVVQKVGK